MMEPADERNCDDRSVCHDRPGHGRIFVERQMRTRVVVVLQVLGQDATQSCGPQKVHPTEFPLNSECEETARTARSRDRDLRRRLCPT
jgi:hypothetical protein